MLSPKSKLSDKEWKVFQIILNSMDRGATDEEIAEKAGIHVTEVYEIGEKLEKMGYLKSEEVE